MSYFLVICLGTLGKILKNIAIATFFYYQLVSRLDNMSHLLLSSLKFKRKQQGRSLV